MNKYRIIQASHARTGSTVLVNLLHGFMTPKQPVHYNSEQLIDKFLITKTHNTNINFCENNYNKYKLFFIMS